MSLYKNLLFLHGHFTDPRMDDGYGYGPTHGNPRADARVRRERREAAAGVTRAVPAPAAVAPDCTAAPCAGRHG